jgi:hypothetical protein
MEISYYPTTLITTLLSLSFGSNLGKQLTSASQEARLALG